MAKKAKVTKKPMLKAATERLKKKRAAAASKSGATVSFRETVGMLQDALNQFKGK